MRMAKELASPATALVMSWGRCSTTAANMFLPVGCRNSRFGCRRCGLASPASRRLVGMRRRSRRRRAAARPARRTWRIIAFGFVVPAPYRGTVVPVIAGAVGGDLEVLTELLISGLPPLRKDFLSQLVPVQVKFERVDDEHLRDQVMEHQNAYLFEEVRKQDVVV